MSDLMITKEKNKMQIKYVITENGKRLSGIYANDIPKNWFKFRKHGENHLKVKLFTKQGIFHNYMIDMSKTNYIYISCCYFWNISLCKSYL